MQLKRQSVEAWQNEKHYSKENNTSENRIPRREIFKSVDHVKYEGQVKWQHLLFVQFSGWAFKLWCYENCYKSPGFFNLAWGEWMDLRNSNGIELGTFTFQPYRSFFRKYSSEMEKCIMSSPIQVLPNEVSKVSFYTFEDIDLRESHAKLHKKLSETLGADSM